jgi:hypothetical protein
MVLNCTFCTLVTLACTKIQSVLAPYLTHSCQLSLITSLQLSFRQYAHWTQRGYYPDDPHKENQDELSVSLNFAGTDKDAMFAIYDGHGKDGHACARFAKNKLPRLAAKHLRAARVKKYKEYVAANNIKGAKLFDPASWPYLTAEEYKACSRKAFLECNKVMNEADSVRNYLSLFSLSVKDVVKGSFLLLTFWYSHTHSAYCTFANTGRRQDERNNGHFCKLPRKSRGNIQRGRQSGCLGSPNSSYRYRYYYFQYFRQSNFRRRKGRDWARRKCQAVAVRAQVLSYRRRDVGHSTVTRPNSVPKGRKGTSKETGSSNHVD